MTCYHPYLESKNARKIDMKLLRLVHKECRDQLSNTFEKRYSCGSHSTDPWIWWIIFFYASSIQQSWIAVNNGDRQVLCQWHSGCKKNVSHSTWLIDLFYWNFKSRKDGNQFKWIHDTILKFGKYNIRITWYRTMGEGSRRI